MTKAKWQMTKDARVTNDEDRVRGPISALGLATELLGLWISSFLHHSSFGIRHSP